MCTFPQCFFRTKSIKSFNSHSDTHTCQCGSYVLDANSSNNICCKQAKETVAPKIPYNPENLDTGIFKRTETAFLGSANEFSYEYLEKVIHITEAFRIVHESLINLITQFLDYFRNVKIEVTITCTLMKIERNVIVQRHLRSPSIKILHKNFLSDSLAFAERFIASFLSIFLDGQSNYSILSIDVFNLKLYQYRVLQPRGYVHMPLALKNRKSLVSVKCENGCFLYSVILCVPALRNTIRLNNQGERTFQQLTKTEKLKLKRKWEVEASFVNILHSLRSNKLIDVDKFLNCTLEDIPGFETSSGISVCVYENIGENIVPVYLTKHKFANVAHLLLLREPSKNIDEKDVNCIHPQIRSHYVSIISLDRFLGRHAKPGRRYCQFCLKQCRSEQYDEHIDKCQLSAQLSLRFFGNANAKYKFRNISAAVPMDFKIFVSLKMCTVPLQPDTHTGVNNKQYVHTTKESNFLVNNYGLVLVGPEGHVLHHEASKQSQTVLEQFITRILFLASECEKIIRDVNVPIRMSQREERLHKLNNYCGLCKLDFRASAGMPKVRDHSHLTGKFRQTLCQLCNILLVKKPAVNVYFFCDSGKIFPFILRSLQQHVVKQVKVIPKSGNNEFCSIIINKFVRFVNIHNFMPTNFADLIESHKMCQESSYSNQFPCLVKIYGDMEKAALFTTKFFDPFVVNEAHNLIKLPLQESMKNYLDGGCPTNEEYSIIVEMWKKLQITNYDEYLQVHSLAQACLIVDIWQSFDKFCMEHFKLSPSHFLSLSGYVYSIAMYNANADWNYVVEPEIAEMINRWSRGGMVANFVKSAVGNNEMIDNFNENEKERVYITSIDLASAYSHIMCSPLPYSDFKLITEPNIDYNAIINDNDQNPTQYIVEADLKYPNELHSVHRSFPLAPSRVTLKDETVSPYQRQLYNDLHSNTMNEMNLNRLALCFGDKEKYVLHSKNLRYYLKMGMKLTKITKAVQFTEKAYLREFILKILKLRQSTNSQFFADLMKRFGNALFGSLGLSLTTRKNIRVCLSREECISLVSKSTFKNLTILGKSTALVELDKESVLYDRPHIQFCAILDLAKLHFFQMYYGNILKAFHHSHVTTCQIDTDGMILKIASPENDFIKRFAEITGNCFDCSNLPTNCKLYSLTNKGKPGYFKFVFGDIANIKEFCALRARSFSLLLHCSQCKNNEPCQKCNEKPNCTNVKKFSGLPNYVIRKLNHANYRDVLRKELIRYIEFRTIQTKNMRSGVFVNSRASLHNLDLSAYWESFNNSYPFFSCEIPESNFK